MGKWADSLTCKKLIQSHLKVPKNRAFGSLGKVINSLSLSLQFLVKHMIRLHGARHVDVACPVASKDDVANPCDDKGKFMVFLIHLDQTVNFRLGLPKVHNLK